MSPRNTAGTFTLATPPVVSGTVASATWANDTLGDIAAALTDSASRTGAGNFTAPVRTPDGTAAAPALAFVSEPASGLYRPGANALGVAIGGVDALRIAPGALGIGAPPNANTNVTISTANQPVVDFVSTAGGAGNKVARLVYDSGAAFGVPSFVFQNISDAGAFVANGLVIRRDGLLQLGAQAAPLQPASIWTAITPNANWTAGAGLGYAKDATGRVLLRGTATFATGAATGFATLPAGFRTSVARGFPGIDLTSSVHMTVNVDATGLVSIFGATLVNGHVYSVDGVSFLAEQ